MFTFLAPKKTVVAAMLAVGLASGADAQVAPKIPLEKLQ